MATKPRPPANYSPHFLAQFGGKLNGGEIWTCGVRLKGHFDPVVTGDPIDQGTMDRMGAALAGWFRDPQHGMSSSATLEYFKLNAISTTGHYMNKTHTNVADLIGVHGSLNPALPAFLSIATTWLTDRTRGPGHVGRVYLPNNGQPAATLDPCIIDPAGQNLIRAAGVALLDLLRDFTTTGPGNLIGYIPVVASSVDASLNIINGVAVGRVVDVIRNRKNAIPELAVKVAYDWQREP